MEWVLTMAFVWWAVVAVLIMTAIIQTATKKPEPRTVKINRDNRSLPMQRKEF